MKKGGDEHKNPHRNQKPPSFDEGFIGAATRIRTGDLILTKAQRLPPLPGNPEKP